MMVDDGVLAEYLKREREMIYKATGTETAVDAVTRRDFRRIKQHVDALGMSGEKHATR